MWKNPAVPFLYFLPCARVFRYPAVAGDGDFFDDFDAIALVRHEMVREFRMHFPATFALQSAQAQRDLIALAVEIHSKPPVVRL